MSMQKKDQKKKKPRQFTNRHGIILIAALAAVILIVNLVAFSYSWFSPGSDSGKGLEVIKNTKLRSENCQFETYRGTVVTEDMYFGRDPYNAADYRGYYIDQVKYDTTKIANNTAISVDAHSRVYFRTQIQNHDEQYPSVVSLYHLNMPANLYVAVTYPTNTFHFVGSDPYPDYFIIRNAYVKPMDENDVNGPGLLTVEWFVENRTDSAIEIKVTPDTHEDGETGDEVIDTVWLYLMYN